MNWGSLKNRQRLSLVLLLTTARCTLPHGDEDLPSTGFKNVNRDVILQVLIAQGDRRVGARLPLTIDVDVASTIAGPGDTMCVRLVGDPGAVLFPLGGDCPAAQATTSSAGGGGVTGGGGVAGGVAGGVVGGGGVAGGGTTSASAVARACITVQPADSMVPGIDGGAASTQRMPYSGRLAGHAIAAYQPQASEAIATVFANLYSDSGCTNLLQSTAVELKLTDAEASSGGAGGTGPEGDAAGSPNGGSPEGGTGAVGGSGGAGGATPGGAPAGGAGGVPDTGGSPASAGQGGHP